MLSVHFEPHRMLSLGKKSIRLCEGWRRRDFLRVGGIGAFGLSLADWLALRARADPSTQSFGRAKRCVLLFLTGGPPQHDTFDPKPLAPLEIRGELSPIETVVPGIQVSELLPRLAGHADKFCLVRSVTHTDTTHTTAGYTMLTGAYHPTPNVPSANDTRPAPTDHPHIGSLVALSRPGRDALPRFVAVPEVIRDAAVNTFPGQDGGFLGRRFDPLLVEADDARERLRMPGLELPAELDESRFGVRRDLRAQVEAIGRRLNAESPTSDLAGYYSQAFDLIGSPAARRDFRLDDEPAAVREAYGVHLFGQGCLLARRLLEAGVALVSVYWHYEGPDDSPVWDTHQNNFAHLRKRLLPPTDQAVSALLDDLATRGLLSDTLLVCMGEFGRSPRINAQAGRDHWPRVQSMLLAGAGIPAGSVYGASDPMGGEPSSAPITPPDLAATLLHLLGVRPDRMLTDPQGRAIVACQGTPVAELLGE